MANDLYPGPIGIFDSGYGGLTILSEIEKVLPNYDYIYLGDNSRAPYGVRSFDIVYEFTKQAVEFLFAKGCNLVILACNTASAKALRTIQQKDLFAINPNKRVLGIIRPTVEIINSVTTSKHVGLVATQGTIESESYTLEIKKLFPDIKIKAHACPMWVPIVENRETNSIGAEYFIQKDIDILLSKDRLIDTIILGCTHYPLLINCISKYVPSNIEIISQGKYVAQSLKDYLFRHSQMEQACSKGKSIIYYTTESENKFKEFASIFLDKEISANRIVLG